MDGNRPMVEKRVKDLMLSLAAFSQISPRRKVAEAVDLLRENRKKGEPLFLLVVDVLDDKQEILGVLSALNLIGHMESSREPTEELPIFWQGQFQEECEALFDVSVSAVMVPVSQVIHETGTLTEAVHLMNRQGIDWLPAVADQEVVGIVLKTALVDEVLSAEVPLSDS